MALKANVIKPTERIYNTRNVVALLIAFLSPLLGAANLNDLHPPANSLGLLQTDAPGTLAPGQVAASATLAYAHNPLIYRYSDGTYDPVVAHQGLLHLSANVGILPLVDGALSLPVLLRQGGGAVGLTALAAGEVGGSGVGDMQLSLRLNALPARIFGGGVGVILRLGLPTGSTAQLTGNGGVSFAPEVVGALPTGPLVLQASVRYNVRRAASFGDTRLGSGFEAHAGARARMAGLDPWLGVPVTALAEVVGATPWQHAFSAGGSQLEVYAGLQTRLAEAWDVTVAGAAGLSQGLGVAAGRLLFTVSWRLDAADRDHDGVPDTADACPDAPEDYNGYADLDGCPDAGDMPQPVADRDHDGIADAHDLCPDIPEDQNGILDTDGCPDADSDHDGVPDIRDRCPTTPETINGREDDDGCPDSGPGDVEYKENEGIAVLKAIQFETSRAAIKSESLPVLDQVGLLLLAHTEVLNVRVEGHTDSVGSATVNQQLSQGRAEAVRTYLMERGVDGARLEAVGYGESRPVDTNDTPAGRARNRRVEFVILRITPHS